MQKEIKDVISIGLGIILLNIGTIAMVSSGKHISPNVASWSTGFVTAIFVVVILKRFNIYLEL